MQMIQYSMTLIFCLLVVSEIDGQLIKSQTTTPTTKDGRKVETSDFEPIDETRDDRDVPLRIYSVKSKTRQPVVLFSHGLGGSRSNNRCLGNYFAQHGYIAVFMQHHGSDFDVIQEAPRLQKLRVLKSAASYESAQARVEDVSFVLDTLEQWNRDSSHPLSGRLDLEHIGLCGHSFGAVTTMTMAGRQLPLGQRPVDEPRIDAFLAMSPQSGKGQDAKTSFGKLKRPIFCMTGTKDGSPIDSSVTPETRQAVYKALPLGDKYHLVLDGAEHHAFGDSENRFRRRQRDPAHHGIIQEFSLKFWDAYLKEDVEAKKWLQSEEAKTVKGFKKSDVYSWK